MKKRIKMILIGILFALYSIGMDVGLKTIISVNAATISEECSPSIDSMMTSVRSYIIKKDTNPDFSSIWNVFDLMRSGLDVPEQYQLTFYKNTLNYLTANNWKITRNRYTDYSKLILAMTVIGKNAQNLEGHNLFYYLSDFTNVKKQGFNGPIWALIALKSHPTYEIPRNAEAVEQTTEEGLVQYLLDKEIPGGGWSLDGINADSDITGMTIQALAPYYDKREEVKKAIDRALYWLSASQQSSGGYATFGNETSESTAQIIVALSSLGIDCNQDSRFIKNRKSPLDALCQYYLAEGGFMHMLPGSDGGVREINGMATEQGMYAMVAYKRLLEGKTSLYDLSDLRLSLEGRAEENSSKEEESTENPSPAKPENNTEALKVKVSKVSLDYSQVTLDKGKKKSLKVTVFPSNASEKAVSWTSSNKKIASVSQSGLVTAVKKGTATITVTAKDGSGVKASCTVIVKEVSTKTVNKKPAVSTSKKQLPTGSVKTGNVTKQSPTGPVQTGNAAKEEDVDQNGDSNSSGEQEQNPAEGESTESGWSFEGEDYVAENYENDDISEEDTEEENSEISEESEEDVDQNDRNLNGRKTSGPLPYVLSGTGILGTIGFFIFYVKKGKKKTK
ncbi:MAG: Ig-like domain-containing protein [Eubacteriales bacterium]|nr:Ig-like domain-containing protein [Eubacteriales bacterium]